jgi:2,4-dienoyl-CoA reductase (NADPH2)
LPQFERIAGVIHENGGIAIQQILHCGRYGGIDLGYSVQPSPVPQTLPHFRPPRELGRDEIRQMITEHADAARRAVKVGFDGVEITSFMGYLLANFNSKFTNQRTDEYGGSNRNRARFMIELIDAIKGAIGDRILCVRLNGAELMDEYGGNSEEECLEHIQVAAESGGVDMISLTVGWQESRVSILGRDVPPGYWNRLAKRAKTVTGQVPIAFGVRLPEAEMANRCIEDGEFDYWEVCRPFLADPDRLRKYAEGREREIKPCIGYLLCLSRLFRDLPYLCAVNPALGHEVEPEYAVTPSAVKKRIGIVGAGPAGLECAIAAAQRGHDVTVFDRSDDIGGQLRIWANNDIATKNDLLGLLGYYHAMVEKQGIRITLNTEIDSNFRSHNPDLDVLVVAAGATISRGPWSSNGAQVMSAYEALDGRDVGARVVVVGGGKVGLVAAESLAQQGRKVVIIESARRLAGDVIPTWKWRHTSWIEEMGIETHTRATLVGISTNGVQIVKEGGEELEIPADTVILTTRESDQRLLDALEFAVDELHVIGDAVKARGLYQAIHEGYRLGCRL